MKNYQKELEAYRSDYVIQYCNRHIDDEHTSEKTRKELEGYLFGYVVAKYPMLFSM